MYLLKELLNIKELSNKKKELDKEVENIFKINSPSNKYKGHLIDLNEAVNYILKLYKALGANNIDNFNSEKEITLNEILPFILNEIILCYLHVKQKLVENTLVYMKKMKQRVNEYNINIFYNRSTTKYSILTNDQCNTILSNIDKITENIELNSAKKYILNLLRNIIIIIKMKQDDEDKLKCINLQKIKELEKLILEFLINCFDVWNKSVKTYYFHYIIHIPNIIRNLLQNDLSLSLLSNQGFKRNYKFYHFVFNRILNNGGGRKKIPLTKQLLLWQWRKVLLALEIKKLKGKTYWNEKRLRKEYIWSTDKKKKENNLFNEYIYIEINTNKNILTETINKLYKQYDNKILMKEQEKVERERLENKRKNKEENKKL
ncbi:hypothetical protein ABK040_007419 [Willaertia magna]